MLLRKLKDFVFRTETIEEVVEIQHAGFDFVHHGPPGLGCGVSLRGIGRTEKVKAWFLLGMRVRTRRMI